MKTSSIGSSIGSIYAKPVMKHPSFTLSHFLSILLLLCAFVLPIQIAAECTYITGGRGSVGTQFANVVIYQTGVFSNPAGIGKVSFSHSCNVSTGSASDIKLQYSTNGSSWSDVESFSTSNSAQNREITASSTWQNATYLRLVTASKGNRYWELFSGGFGDVTYTITNFTVTAASALLSADASVSFGDANMGNPVSRSFNYSAYNATIHYEFTPGANTLPGEFYIKDGEEDGNISSSNCGANTHNVYFNPQSTSTSSPYTMPKSATLTLTCGGVTKIITLTGTALRRQNPITWNSVLASQGFTMVRDEYLPSGDITYIATALSGETVTFQSGNSSYIEVVDNTGLHALDAGAGRSVSITAKTAGTVEFVPANLTKTFNISTKQKQTITWNQTLSFKTTDAASQTFTATASSGLGITYTSSDPSVVQVTGSGPNFTIMGEGKAVITATQAGNDSYIAVSTTRVINVRNPLSQCSELASNQSDEAFTFNRSNPKEITLISNTVPDKLSFRGDRKSILVTASIMLEEYYGGAWHTLVASLDLRGSTYTYNLNEGTSKLRFSTDATISNAQEITNLQVTQKSVMTSSHASLSGNIEKGAVYSSPFITITHKNIDVMSVSCTGPFAVTPATIGAGCDDLGTDQIQLTGTPNTSDPVSGTITITDGKSSNPHTITIPYNFTISSFNQVITWNCPESHSLISGNTMTLDATAPGGEITYTIPASESSIATISGNVITFLGEGTIHVTASQDGAGSKYEPAVPVTKTITACYLYADGMNPVAYAGHSQITLSWLPVTNATHYAIERDGVRILAKKAASFFKTKDGRLWYIDDNKVNGTGAVQELATLTTYSYQIVAIANYAGADREAKCDAFTKKTSEITAADAPYFGLKTPKFHANHAVQCSGGYVGSGNDTLSLVNCFNGISTIFTDLYVHGQAVKDSKNVWHSHRFHYTPTGGNTYVYDGVNQDAYTTRIGDFTVSSGGIKKVYFAGNAAICYTGITDVAGNGENSDNGVICFTGGSGASVDIYLDNYLCKALAKSNAVADRYNLPGYLQVGGGNDDKDKAAGVLCGAYASGAASPIALVSTTQDADNPFNVRIHLMGESTLKNAGASQVKGATVAGSNIPGLSAIFETIIGTSGIDYYATPVFAPLAIVAKSMRTACTMTIDDEWPGKGHTNGKVNLVQDMGSGNTGSVDLGNEHGKLIIESGQVHFTPGASTSDEYSNSLVASWRHYDMTIELDAGNLLGTIGGSLRLMNVGSDASGKESNPFGSGYCGSGQVIINGGTITVDKPVQWGTNAYGQKNQEIWNYQPYTLRLPADSKINGGTFNGGGPDPLDGNTYKPMRVRLVSELSGAGGSPVNNCDEWLCRANIAPTMSPKTNGTVDMTIPYGTSDCSALYSALSPQEAVIDSHDNMLHPLVPGDAGVDASLIPNCNDVEEMARNNWLLVIPQISLISGTGNTDLSQAQEMNSNISKLRAVDPNNVPESLLDEISVYNKNFAYVETNSAMDGKQYLGVNLSIGDEGYYTGNNPVLVQDNLYLMRFFDPNKWEVFVPPFDISKVYVVEASLSVDPDVAGQENFSLCCEVGWPLLTGETTNDLITVLTGNCSIRSSCKGVFGLTAYNGSNLYDAHYYLYKSNKNIDMHPDNDDFHLTWDIVTETTPKTRYHYGDAPSQTENVLMKAGEPYALMFPDYKGNYWPHKYIVFEGQGPQIIQPTCSIATSISPEKAQFHGNTSFNKLTWSGNNGYILQTETSTSSWQFLKMNTTADKTIKPGRGFLVVNESTAIKNMMAVRNDGSIIYDNIEDYIEGPRTLGEIELIVYSDNGLLIDSKRDQDLLIYDATGLLVYSGHAGINETVHVNLPNGMYIVSNGKSQIKTIVND